jgi:dihydroneopterin aldolase
LLAYSIDIKVMLFFVRHGMHEEEIEMKTTPID